MSRRLLFLIGYRGAGKTEVARLLAPLLGWQWIDADAVLEERFGKSIRQIFAEEGEPSFRNKEAAILQELSQLQDHVVATGGGVVLRPDNRAALQRGHVVWLQAPSDVLWQRMRSDASTAERRPNLAQGGIAEIEAMLSVRTPLYEECQDLIVDTSKGNPALAAEVIRDWLTSRAHSSCP
ncbi:MAG TPA: shikimate kinase [Gemmataceae bacterium]|nr:shikimate kinase [Gemmataceae bacterium]